jgi:protoheme IX farnesyltransferase
VVIGGAAGSFPVLTGWAVARADWPIMPIALAALVFFWTPAHFWAYSMWREADYHHAQVPMLPTVVGVERTPLYILGNAILTVMTSLMAFSGWKAVVVAALGLVFLALSVALRLRPSSQRAHQMYKASNYYLLLVFFCLFL